MSSLAQALAITWGKPVDEIDFSAGEFTVRSVNEIYHLTERK